MKTIELHSRKYPGLVATVDDGDFEILNQYRWWPTKSRNTFYAATGHIILMHKLITGYDQTDHKNRDGLDNQRSNLRPVTTAQNRCNTAVRVDNKSGFKGVSWRASSKKWRARIKVNGKYRHLGLFPTKIAAALAFDRAAREVQGEYACLNFPYTTADLMLVA